MSDTHPHTYHPTSMPGRGVYVLTTTDPEEAHAMQQAVRVREALADVLAWEGAIAEAVEQANGKGATYRDLVKALVRAGDVLADTLPVRPS
jgi:hypothetical protein